MHDSVPVPDRSLCDTRVDLVIRDSHGGQALSTFLTHMPKCWPGGEQAGCSVGRLRGAWNERWALSPSVPPLHLGMMLVGTCTIIHPQDVLPTTHSKLETWSTPQVLARQEVAPWNAAWPECGLR